MTILVRKITGLAGSFPVCNFALKSSSLQGKHRYEERELVRRRSQ
jgi:hypothetical protein